MTEWTTIILAVGAVAIPIVGLATRSGKGIGWQFIRFTVIGSSIPVVAILALNKILPSEAIATLLGTALGYAFGRSTDGKANDA